MNNQRTNKQKIALVTIIFVLVAILSMGTLMLGSNTNLVKQSQSIEVSAANPRGADVNITKAQADALGITLQATGMSIQVTQNKPDNQIVPVYCGTVMTNYVPTNIPNEKQLIKDSYGISINSAEEYVAITNNACETIIVTNWDSKAYTNNGVHAGQVSYKVTLWSAGSSATDMSTIYVEATTKRVYWLVTNGTISKKFYITANGFNETGDGAMEAPNVTQIPVPTANTGLVYTGSSIVGVNPGTGYELTNASATLAGKHTATAKLKTGYAWNTGVATTDRNIEYAIGMANQAELNIRQGVFTYGDTIKLGTSNPGSGVVGVYGGGSGIGAISYTILSGGTGTATISNGVDVTVTQCGTLNIRATKAADNNYNSTYKDFMIQVNKASQVAPVIGIDYIKETLTGFTPGQFYKIGSEADFKATSATISVTKYIGQNISVVKKGDVNHNDSAACSVTVKARPSAVAISASKTDTSITINGASGAEYSFDGGAWSSVTSFSGLGSGTTHTIKARLKATSSSFYGAEFSLSVRTNIVVTINTQPTNVSIVQGNVDSFSVSASLSGSTGATLKYQWYWYANPSGTANKCSGATATQAIYNIDTQSVGKYWYRCEVSSSDATVASVWSEYASLVVIKAVAQVDGINYPTLDAAITAVNANNLITLLSDIELQSAITINKRVLIDGCNFSITRQTAANMFEVVTNGVLSLENITLNGSNLSNAIIANGGTFNLGAGAKLTGSKTAIFNNGTLTLIDGIIEGDIELAADSKYMTVDASNTNDYSIKLMDGWTLKNTIIKGRTTGYSYVGLSINRWTYIDNVDKTLTKLGGMDLTDAIYRELDGTVTVKGQFYDNATADPLYTVTVGGVNAPITDRETATGTFTAVTATAVGAGKKDIILTYTTASKTITTKMIITIPSTDGGGEGGGGGGNLTGEVTYDKDSTDTIFYKEDVNKSWVLFDDSTNTTNISKVIPDNIFIDDKGYAYFKLVENMGAATEAAYEYKVYVGARSTIDVGTGDPFEPEEKVTKQDNSITITTLTGWEYSLIDESGNFVQYNSANWTKGKDGVSITFSPLLQKTKYAVQARKIGTDTTQPGKIIPKEITTKGEEIAPTATIDFINEKLTGLVANAKYKLTIGGVPTELTADSSGNIALGSDWFGKDISIVKTGVVEGSINNIDSKPQVVTITARQVAEAIVLDKAATTDTQIVINEVAGQEYSINGVDWVTGTDGKVIFSGKVVDTQYAITTRVKATATNFVGAQTSAQFKTKSKEVTPTYVIDYVNEAITGLVANSTYIIDSTEYTSDSAGKIAFVDALLNKQNLTIIKKCGAYSVNSDPSAMFNVPERNAVPAATISYQNKKLTGLVANKQYLINETIYTASASGEIEILSGWFGGSLQIIQIYDDIKLKSDAQTLAISAIPVAVDIEFVSKTDNQIVINAVAGQEYSINGVDWVTGTDGKVIFGGLTKVTEYTILTKIPFSASAFVSDTKSLVVTTLNKEDAPTFVIDLVKEEIGGLIKDDVYIIGGKEYTADKNGKIKFDDDLIGKNDLTIIKKGTDGESTDSAPSEVFDVPARAEKPVVEVDYPNRVIDVGEPNTEFVVTVDGKEIVITTDPNGKIDIKDEWRNKTITIQQKGKGTTSLISPPTQIVIIQYFKLTINYATDGVSDKIITVDNNKTAAIQDNPIRAGYDFTGWYKDSLATQEFSFKYHYVTADITIYAGWVKKDSADSNIIITFKADGSPDLVLTVAKNSYLNEVESPLKDNMSFDGWFTDSNFTNRYYFGEKIVSSITLYAKFVSNKVTVTIYGGESAQIDYGAKFAKPTDPVKAGYVFAGWYTDSNNIELFVFDGNNSKNGVTYNITLYPKFVQETYSVTGKVIDENGNPVVNATVTIDTGSKKYVTTTGSDGTYAVTNVPDGIYKIVIDYSTDGGLNTTTVTEAITVDGKDYNVGETKLKGANLNSTVKIEGKAPEVAVGGLNDLFNGDKVVSQFEKDEAKKAGNNVEIKFVVSDNLLNDSIFQFATKNKKVIGSSLDFSLFKITTVNGKQSKNYLSSLEKTIKIIVPLSNQMIGKTNYIMYRLHDGSVDEIKLGEANANASGEFMQLSSDGKYLIVYTKNFSSYAIAYDEPIVVEDSCYIHWIVMVVVLVYLILTLIFALLFGKRSLINTIVWGAYVASLFILAFFVWSCATDIVLWIVGVIIAILALLIFILVGKNKKDQIEDEVEEEQVTEDEVEQAEEELAEDKLEPEQLPQDDQSAQETVVPTQDDEPAQETVPTQDDEPEQEIEDETDEEICDTDIIAITNQNELKRADYLKAKRKGIIVAAPIIFKLSREDVLDFMAKISTKFKAYTPEDNFAFDDNFDETAMNLYPVEPNVKLRASSRGVDSLRCGDWCFSLLYTRKDNLKFVVRCDDEYASNLALSHTGVKRSLFPKGDNWYDVVVDGSYSSKKEIFLVLYHCYLFALKRYYQLVDGVYTTDVSEALKADQIVENDIAANANTVDIDFENAIKERNKAENEYFAVVSSCDITKQKILNHIRQLKPNPNKTIEINQKKPTSPASIKVNGKTYAIVYQGKTITRMILRLDDTFAESISLIHPMVRRAKFPKGFNWYMVEIDSSFKTNRQVYALLTKAKNYVCG